MNIDGRTLILLGLFISLPLLTSWLDSLDRYLLGVKPGVTINGEDVGGLLPEEVTALVENLAIRYQKVPIEPGLDKQSGEIIAEEKGCIISLEENIEQIMSAREGEQVHLIITPVYPQYSGHDIEEAKHLVGAYTTWVSGSEERHSNIRLAVNAINNTLLWPGEVFSFNTVVGPRGMAQGYLPAPIIMQGQSEMGFGGGVCQVSSTLFNAVESAGAEIIERHQHSKRVHYVPMGKDATVTYGYLDFRFKNTLQGPIIIKAGISGGKVWVNILGREK